MSDASSYSQYRTRLSITSPSTTAIIHTRTSAFTTMRVRIYMFIIYSRIVYMFLNYDDVFVLCISIVPLLVYDVLFQLC